MTINSDDPDSPVLKVPLTGEGVEPNIAVNPPSVNFGPVAVGVQKSDTLTVNNTGGDTLRISQVSTNVSPQPFNALPIGSLPADVLPGGSIKIVVQFQPPSLGTHRDTVRITSNDPDSSVVKVPLTGEGVEPNIAVNPPSVNFGPVAVGGGKAYTVEVNNTGTDTLTISSFSTFAPFGALLIGPDRIAPGGFSKIEVKFQPDSVRVFNDTLTIISNDPDEGIVKVPLTGQGVVGPEIFKVFVSRDPVPIGAHVRIFADVTDEDGVASVEAKVRDANDAGFTPAHLTLFNDGEHKDGLPGDRLWASEPWPTPADRPREFLVDIWARDNLNAESHTDSAASFATADPSIFVTLGAGEEIAGPGGQAQIPIFAVGLDDKGVIAGEITLRFDQASVKFLKAYPGPGRDFPGSFDFNSPEPWKGRNSLRLAHTAR